MISGLRAARLAAGLSPADVAQRTGYSIDYLQRIENTVEKRRQGVPVVLPALYTAERICKALTSPAFPDGAPVDTTFYKFPIIRRDT